jgi:hypothetical protein
MSNTTKREIVEYVVAIVAVIGSIIFLIAIPHPTSHTYDCSISEISPDYPPAVKEGCRKLRADNFNKDLQKPK